MKYNSTRDRNKVFSASEAIVKGIADDGGLIVPSSFPTLTAQDIVALSETDYPERAANILARFMDEFSYDELLGYTSKAYSKFDGDPCPVSKVDDNLFFLELWHGPTFAFKDMALTLLPYLMTASKKKIGEDEKTLILVATSGDTGKAALAGFKDVEGTEIIVFYPSKGVSDMQRLQMVTQEGANVHVAGILGNFDDAQTSVKTIFNDKAAIAALKAKGIAMSSANSINLGRLLPQVVYYISAYVDLVASGEIENGDKINFVVPTGNFGNVLAGYYAYRMGLPVKKLIIASNANNILTDFFHSGKYDTKREFFKTMSPSMDILVSSNLERFIYELLGRDDNAVNALYKDLKEKGSFTLAVSPEDIGAGIFESGWADEEETKEIISTTFEEDDYVVDPHTAVAMSVYTDYLDETGDDTPTVIVSTASPYKFPRDVYDALGGRENDNQKAMGKMQALTGLPCPAELYYLKDKTERHTTVIEKDKAFETVMDFVEGRK